ncbi:MAG TPA: YiiX/YebB-like N1pC/P60 family cysteine hydrolase [Planctomycetota bacterium]|nr:YiiX/YebB-like N1pC/P60 family cysteine hydrolase [Planctomycetota bacterium]
MAVTPLSPPPRKKRLWIWVLLPLLLLAFGVAAFWAFTPAAPDPIVNLAYLIVDHPVKHMNVEQFETQVNHDMLELASHRKTLAQLDQDLTTLVRDLPPDAGKITPEQRRELKMLWMSFIDHQIALIQMKEIYKVFPAISRFSATSDRYRHARTFAVAFYIHLLQVDSAWKLITAFNGRPDYENILDEQDRDLGIAGKTYARLKFQVLHVQTVAEMRVLDTHFLTLKPNHYKPFAEQFPAAADQWVPGAVEETFPRVMGRYHTEGAQQFAKNAEDLVKEGMFKSWFPVQKQVSEWMGDTTVAQRKSLITLEQIAALEKALQPGDIILERRNWYLSNVGLPGFWPHAEFYTGTPEEMEQALGGDPEVQAFLKVQGVATIHDLLDKRFPKVLKQYTQPIDAHPARIIEAVSEGVVLSTCEHSCRADYIAALRPRVPPIDRLKAILTAFSHFEKPYDFDFDFITDDAIVCSELVFKSWRPDVEKHGVRLDLKEVMGRKVLPTNEFAGLFKQELGHDDRQLDFVYFLEGNEGEGKAHVADGEALAKSYTRPKWDILQD